MEGGFLELLLASLFLIVTNLPDSCLVSSSAVLYFKQSMIIARRAPADGVKRYVTNTVASSHKAQHGRTAAYRRINTLSTLRRHDQILSSYRPIDGNKDLRYAPPQTLSLLRSLHSSPSRFQQAQPKEPINDPPRPEEAKEEAPKAESEQKAEGEEKEGEGKEEHKDKKDSAPPPPHGDKTPWQVFRETLSTEFKASKEWNESTKQLGGRVQTFNESEGVRRAREASEAATSGASKVIKGTGKVVGQSAAWTWNTSAVQGVRAGVNATGRGIEQVTRPVRETKAFKDISEAIDDGSSTRYGGWTEKEERRLRRRAQMLKEGGLGGRPAEKMEEDPK